MAENTAVKPNKWLFLLSAAIGLLVFWFSPEIAVALVWLLYWLAFAYIGLGVYIYASSQKEKSEDEDLWKLSLAVAVVVFLVEVIVRFIDGGYFYFTLFESVENAVIWVRNVQIYLAIAGIIVTGAMLYFRREKK